MKRLLALLPLLLISLSGAACPDGNMNPIGPNSSGGGKMPYQITLDFLTPKVSFFRINAWGNAEVYRFDISTDKGKQIYAMLLASKSQCRTLKIFTGDNMSDNDGSWVDIKKIVLD